MLLEEIRQKLEEKIPECTEWEEKLDHTTPGHYGIDDSEVIVYKEHIWVDIPSKTFTFKKADFNFDLKLGASSDGMEDSFSKVATGKGTFDFINENKDIEIKELEIEVDLDLYADDGEE